MSIGKSLPPRKRPKSEWDQLKEGRAGEAGSVLLNVDKKKKKVKITPTKIKNIAKGMAEIAASFGETNDPAGYADFLEEDVLFALKEVQRRQERKENEGQN